MGRCADFLGALVFTGNLINPATAADFLPPRYVEQFPARAVVLSNAGEDDGAPRILSANAKMG